MLIRRQGNVGAAEGGFPFLDEQDIVSEIVKIAQESPVLTVRGYVSRLATDSSAHG